MVPTRYIAYLRAINVGGRTVKMAALRGLFESFGYVDVETFIASGNVIFRTPQADAAPRSPRNRALTSGVERSLEQSIETALAQSLGFTVDVFVRSTADNARLAGWTPNRAQPFPGEGDSLYVGFLKDAPTAAVRRAIGEFSNDVDRFFFNEREVYWLCRKTISTSDFSGARLEKLLGAPTTMRNITTVRKLARLHGVEPAG